MTNIEEFAIWLAETGIGESADSVLHEGADPASGRGEELSAEEWRAGRDLAYDMASAVRDNPEAFLAWVREHRDQSEEEQG